MTTPTPGMGVAAGVSAWTTPETVIKSIACAGVDVTNKNAGQIKRKTTARIRLSRFSVLKILIRTLDTNFPVVSSTRRFGHIGGQLTITRGNTSNSINPENGYEGTALSREAIALQT